MCEGPQCNEIVLMSSVGKSRPCKRLRWDDLPATSSTQFHLITSAIKAGLDTPFCLVFLVNFFQPYLVKTTTRPPTHSRRHTPHTSCGENKRHNGISINDYLQLSLYLYIHIYIDIGGFHFLMGFSIINPPFLGNLGYPPLINLTFFNENFNARRSHCGADPRQRRGHDSGGLPPLRWGAQGGREIQDLPGPVKQKAPLKPWPQSK